MPQERYDFYGTSSEEQIEHREALMRMQDETNRMEARAHRLIAVTAFIVVGLAVCLALI